MWRQADGPESDEDESGVDAEEHDHIADEQWGGQQGGTAIDLVLSEEIFMTTSHMQRAAGAITYLDATACHDRIVTNMLILAYAAAGLPWMSCLLFGRTLKQMKHCITTACGPSSMFDTASAEDPFHGPGQGAMDGPSAWTNMCNTIMNAFKPKARGCKMADPTKTLVWK